MPEALPQWPSRYYLLSKWLADAKVSPTSPMPPATWKNLSLSESFWLVKSDHSKVPEVDPCRRRHSELNQWLHDFEHYEFIIDDEFIHGDVRSWASWQRQQTAASSSLILWLTLAHIPTATSKDVTQIQPFLIYRNFKFKFQGSFFCRGYVAGWTLALW